ncbi:MAG TPA: ABC transporter ATP-binding protein [Blastocatellia bacterium]|nr:ABC transporter ATP-binding protein [Blastocatellia bacterium]
MTGEFIKVDSVSKRFGPVVAVDRLSVSVQSGEVYSLVGANGAGKSTLIKMIAGITEPDSGRALICGEDLSHRLPATKRRLGYLPEELILYDRLTGREYLRLVAGLKAADPRTIETEIEFFELTDVADKWTGGYSLGMRKKLGLAGAVIGSPEVLVLDEPLNGLDVEMMRKLRIRLDDERSRGKAVIVSSHVMSFVERVSGRVGVMRGGRLIAEGSPAELRDLAGLPDAAFEDVFFRLVSATD